MEDKMRGVKKLVYETKNYFNKAKEFSENIIRNVNSFVSKNKKKIYTGAAVAGITLASIGVLNLERNRRELIKQTDENNTKYLVYSQKHDEIYRTVRETNILLQQLNAKVSILEQRVKYLEKSLEELKLENDKRKYTEDKNKEPIKKLFGKKKERKLKMYDVFSIGKYKIKFVGLSEKRPVLEVSSGGGSTIHICHQYSPVKVDLGGRKINITVGDINYEKREINVLAEIE